MRYPLLPYTYMVDRLRRDCRLPDYNFRPDDMKEWLAEAVRGLVAPRAFAERTVAIHFKNHSAKLPTDWAGYKCGCAGFVRHYNTLRFTASEGIVNITYYVLPVDPDGMPMLIDIPEYLDYVFWFVAEKLCMLEDLPPKFTPNYCMVQKLDYKKVAETTLTWPITSQSRNFTPPPIFD